MTTSDADDPTRPDDGPPDAWAEADRAYEQKWSTPEAEQAAQAESDLGALSAEPDPFSSAPGTRRPAARPTPASVGDSYLDGMQAAGPYLGLGVQIAASMAVFTGGGYAVDLWLGSTPWGLLIGAALGMVGIVALIVRVAREADARKPKRK
ncbi:MAG TPA: AtpZ/AtpI family protein [Rubricoccaceae bacterium]|jgi:hypothetical protein